MAISWSAVAEEPRRPVDGIMDNSFLIEEAYNQEKGVVQHIFTGVYNVDRISGTRKRALDMSVTEEWPVFSQDHQFSYTVPYGFVWENGDSRNGVGDVLLNYRYQAYFDEKSLMAFAPRFSLVLPTGEDEEGFGNGVLGYQWNLPFSTALGDRWFVHANAGLTFLPEASRTHDYLNYNLGASTIYCINDRLHLMLEWIGNWNHMADRFDSLSHEFSTVISPGVRYAFNLKSGAQIVVGLAAPIGLNNASPDLGGFVYFSFEHKLFGAKEE